MNWKPVIVATSLVLANIAGAANWLTDFKAAQEQAKKENKVILVNFTGSDWCGWCIKLKSEVFSQADFDNFAAQNLVLLEIDFPRRKPMSVEAKRANGAFADKYNVMGYPTLHVLDDTGKSLGQLGYIPGGPAPFLAKVKSIAGNRIKAPTVTDNKPKQPEAQSTPDGPAPPPFNGAPTHPPQKYSDLNLKGISGSGNKRFAMINNQTLGVGESGNVKVGDTQVRVKCAEIHDDFVVVLVGDANTRRELRLRSRL
ncbi:MAG: thioredoxin family protein [Verrucomicrobia subdivision 3 bacterium]|nr:thioredoxin family protein [Limisphaerales bacterium]